MTKIFSSYNQISVHHASNLLAAEGVRAEVRNLYLSSAMGELPPAECQAELWVEERDLERALEILGRRPSGPDWRCGCGEVLGPQFSHCWSCGALRISAPA